MPILFRQGSKHVRPCEIAAASRLSATQLQPPDSQQLANMPSFSLQKATFYTTKGHLLACKRWPLVVQDTAFRYAVCRLSQFVSISGAWPFLCFSNPQNPCPKCAWLFWETKKACHERHAFYNCNPTRRGITAESRTFLAAWLSL